MAANHTAKPDGGEGRLWLRFGPDLAPLVRRPTPGGLVDVPLTRRASVKDVVEALGVPHTEIYALRSGGREVDFGHVPGPGERLDILGPAAPVDVTMPTPLRPRALPALSFAADVNVGKLAQLLRMAGLDCLWRNDFQDADLARRADEEGRVVLTTDRALLKRSRIQWGRLVRACHPPDQLREVLSVFHADGAIRPLSRCIRCNVPLVPVPKAEVLHQLEPRTKRYYEEFARCPRCGRIFWAGSHHDHMRGVLGRLLPAGGG